MKLERQRNDLFSRLFRFAERAGSPQKFVAGLVEEGFVRAWSHERVRAIARPLIPTRYPEKWVFLVGCYNSGTTLLQNLLGSHPQIASLPREGVRFTSVLSNLEVNDHHMMWDDGYDSLRAPTIDNSQAFHRIAADWSIFWKRGASIFLDKSVANTARVSWLREVFPEARFVGIHRNGYCIAEGLHRRAQPPKWYREKYGSDRYRLEDTGRQWLWANSDMIDAFGTDPNCKLIRFEELIERPVDVLESIFSFINVAPGAMRVDGRNLSLAGRSFDIRDPNPSSLARLSESEMDRLDAIIGPMMDRLGYPRVAK
jgi:Sulfotransferase family